MSATPSPVISMDAAENPYVTVLNKRVRAYKKKVERISALKGKQNLEKEQLELCAHADLYNSILTELLLIKSQFDEIDATKVDNVKKDVEEVPVKQESTESIPCPIPAPVNQFDVSSKEEPSVPVVEQTAEPTPEEEEESKEEVLEEAAVEVQEAPKEECSETAAVEEKQPEEGKKEKKPRRFYHGRNGDHKGNDNHTHSNRNNQRGNYHKNNKRGVVKDEVGDGWETPKKVVYIKKENQQ